MSEARNIPAKSPDNGSSFQVVNAARTSENINVETGIATEATWLPENRQFTRFLTHSHASESQPDPLLSLLENHLVDRSPGAFRAHPQPTHRTRRPARGNESLPGRVAEVIWTEALPPNLPSSPATRPDYRRSDFIRRVAKAQNLLLNPHYSVEEIPFELGFASPDVLSRTFTRLIGESPRVYRSRLGGLAAADEK